MKFVLAAALLASTSGPAMAATLEYQLDGLLTTDFKQGPGGVTTSIAVKPFDPKLGTLEFVTFGFGVTLDATFDYASPTPATFDVDLSYADPANPASYSLSNAGGGLFGGEDRFGQVIGNYAFGASVRNSRKGSIDFFNDKPTFFGMERGTDLSQRYAQDGLALNFRYFPQMSVTGLDPAAYQWTFANRVSGRISYYYTPAPAADPAVPEPATWAMTIAGVGAAGAALRRRRRTTVRYAIA